MSNTQEFITITMRKSKKKYEPLLIPYELDEYSLGSWLKKNAKTIGLTAGAIGAMALTGGLAAPAVGAGLAGTAGTAAGLGAAGAVGGTGASIMGATAAGAGLAGTGAAAGGIGSTLGAAGLGSGIGGSIGGGIQGRAEQDEANVAQNSLMNQQQNILKTSQQTDRIKNDLINYAPTFMCGGRMKKYGEGGNFPGGDDPLTQMATTPQTTVIEDRDRETPQWNVDRPDSLAGSLREAVLKARTTMLNYPTQSKYAEQLRSIADQITKYPRTEARGQEEYDYYAQNIPGLSEYLNKKTVFIPEGRGFSNLANPITNPSGGYYYRTSHPQEYEAAIAAMTTPATQPITTRANGGIINYSGQTHEGPNNGIPVDAQGNPSIVSKQKPVALTEDKEVTWLTPNGDSYVFSDKLGYSEKANKLINKYKRRLGGKLDGVDDLSWKGLNNDLTGLSSQQEDYRQGLESNMGNISYSAGGKIEINPESKGRFTQWAKSHNMKVQEAAKHVMAHKDEYSSTLIKENNFAKNSDGGKREFKLGGDLDDEEYGGEYENPLMYAPGRNRGGYRTSQNKQVIPTQPAPTTPLQNNTTTKNTPELSREQLRVAPISGIYPENLQVGSDFNLNKALQEKLNMGTLPISYFPQNISQEQLTPFTGNVSPLGAIGSIAGNAILMGGNKAQTVNLPRQQAEQVSYSQERANAKENYLNARANLMGRLKSAGLSPSQYAQAVLSGSGELNTLANQTVGSSLQNEANTNTGLRSQANQQNAQLAMREAMINAQAQQGADYRNKQYMANILQAPINYLSESQRATQMYDMANAEGKAGIYNDPNNTLAQKLLGLKKYQIKAKKNA